MTTDISPDPSHVLAAIAFEAQRIVSATAQHAAGAEMPDPILVARVITRMAELNAMLIAISKPAANTQAA